MHRWSDLEADAPELAAAGRALIYQVGVGLGYIATVRRDGGPRLHPICLNIVEDGLYALIVDSPKQRDLTRDGRYAVHTFPSADSDDEFYVTGRAVQVSESERVTAVRAAQTSSGGESTGDELLFELLIERVLHAKYKPRGEPHNWPPVYTRWPLR